MDRPSRDIRILHLAAAALLAMLAQGCSDTGFQEATGKGSIRGIHAVAGLADVAFLIEERNLGSISYKASSSVARYDNLSYTFNFDLPRINDTVLRLASRDLDVVADTAYTFTLAGTPGNEEVFLWERPEREWSEGDTLFDINIAHANTTLGAVDVYLAADGTAPVAGNQAGTVAYGEFLDAIDFEAGEYEITVTAQGDPATILFRGTTVTVGGAQSYTLVLLDADPGITGPVAARLVNDAGATIEVADERFPPTLQFLNASFESGSIDVAVDSDFANPAVTNLAFGAVSGDVDVPFSADYQFVPTGNTMALIEAEIPAVPGSRSLVILSGDAGDLVLSVVQSIRRGYEAAARFRLINTVTDTDAVDIFVTAPGTVVDENTLAVAFGAVNGFTLTSARVPGDYEVTVTENGDRSNVLAGPIAVSLPANEVVELVVLDTADPNIADLLVFSN